MSYSKQWLVMGRSNTRESNEGERVMIPQELQDLLAQRNNAIVAVNRRSGGPHVTPVWYVWDGEDFYFSITTDRAKYSNIKRDPSISLIVDEGPGYVAAYGEAEFLDLSHPYVPALAEQ